MKNLKYLVLLLVAIFIIPFVAYAEGEETTAAEDVDSRAVVYFFHGDGCPHCEEATEWFNSIKKEYGSKFKLVKYEVWNNEDNANMMQQVATFRQDDASGVPYIICGDQSWIGFDVDSMGPEIKAKIDEVSAQPVEERYDAVKLATGKEAPASTETDTEAEEVESSSNDVVALVIILVVVCGVCFGVYKARSTTN